MGQEAQELLANTTKWTEKLYDMAYDPYNDDKNEVLQYVKNNGGNQIVYIEYSYKQIGLDDEWLRNMYNMISNPLTVKREILLQRLRGSSDSPFEQEDIEYVINMVRPPISELYILEHFRFDVYTELNRTTPYLIGVDCSTGTNGDNNAVTILDPYTIEPVAEFKCPFIGETMFEKLLMELIKKHLPRAVLCIERNSVGDGIIDHLLNSPIRQNLYFDKNIDLVESKMQENETVVSMLKKQGERKTYYGVWTGTQTRPDMMAILMNHMAEKKDKFVTNNITEDISRLVRTRSGKIEAGPGFHDDSVMSYLISLYVYYHGNNLLRFGIHKGEHAIQEQNKGMKYYEDYVDSGVFSQSDLEIIHLREKTMKENDYESMMKNALLESQRHSMNLHRHGLVKNDVIDNTPDGMIDELVESDGDISMSFFDELNGF
jgi:hypothetical protein